MQLVINKFGTQLGRDSSGFVITDGDGQQRLPAAGITSIQLSGGAQITSDAIMLAVENEIEVLFVGKGGEVRARVWSPKYGSISTIRKGQLAFTFHKDSVEWIKQVIMSKIDNQQAMMLMLGTRDEARQVQVDRAINRLEDYRTKVKALSADVVADLAPTLRGWEGVASKIYFDTVNLFLPECYRFAKRTQHPAMDVANAMLNYGYGMLYGRIEGAMIKAGIDPYIGVMHRDDYNRPVLVYDVIELYRMWVDYVVVSLLMQHAVTAEHCSVQPDGSVWLEQLGRRILIQSLNDFLAEVVDAGGGARLSRLSQIGAYVQQLAQKFKAYV